MLVEKELLAAAVAAEPVGIGRPGLAPLLAMSLAVLGSCSGRHPETCHTASGSGTGTTADSPEPAAAAAAAAAEFVAFESVAGVACAAAAAAVWPLRCQTEAVSCGILWP